MAKKTMLEQARQAYNKNTQTKGGKRNAKKNKGKVRTPKKRAVGTSYDSVREKTQSAGNKGVENRKNANIKKIATDNAKQAKKQTKGGAYKPVKSNWGEISKKTQVTKVKPTKVGKIGEGVIAAPVGSFVYHTAKNATDAAGWASKQGFRAKDTSARNRRSTTTKNDRRNSGQTRLSQIQVSDHKTTQSKTQIYEKDKNGNVKTDKNGNPVLTEYGKSQKQYAKSFKKASKYLEKKQDETLEHGAKALGLSDKKTYSIPDVPIVNKFLPSTEEQRKSTRKAQLKAAGLDKKSIQSSLDEIDAYANEQGFTKDTLLENGMTYGEYRKKLESDMYADRKSAIAAINENMDKEGVGKISATDIYKGGNKALDELADYLIPYGGSTKAALKAAEGILKAGKTVKAGKALTTLGDDVVKGLSKGGKKYVREAVENGLKNGENLGDVIKDVSKAVSKSNLKQNIKKELIANAIQDATLGTTIDALKGKQQGLKGDEFKKYMAENAVMNAAFGMPISMIAGRTGKAGKTAIKEGITDTANATLSMSKAEGVELGTLLKKADNGSLMGKEQERLHELQQKAFGSEHFVVNAKGKIVQNNADTTIEALSKQDAKQYLNLKAKQASGMLKPHEMGQYVQLQKKVEGAYKQTETVSEKIINLNSKAIKSKDLGDAETAVRFYERTGDTAKLKVAQKALESAKVATKNLNESLDNAMKTMTEKTGIEYKWVTGDEMKALGADEDSLVKGFTQFDENGKATVLINRESPQAWQAVVGHETMHLIKKSNPQAYKELADSLEKYVKEIGDYDELEAIMRRNYPELQGNDPANMADFREEMVSEMLGRYVFGEDDKFIKRLAGENPTALEKIVDYIKNLIKRSKNPELAEQFNKFVNSADEAIRAINKDEVAKNVKGEYNGATEVAENGRGRRNEKTGRGTTSKERSEERISRSDNAHAVGGERSNNEGMAIGKSPDVAKANDTKSDGDKPWAISKIVDSDKNVTEEANTAYLKAAESGDLETAQKFIDSLAEIRFSDSVVRNKDGSLKKVTHGTPLTFEIFMSRSEMGNHFGTRKAAEEKMKNDGVSNPNYIEAYLDIKKPIVIDEDLDSWDASHRLTGKLYEMGILDEAEYDFLKDANTNENLQAFLQHKGYDGIQYINGTEDKGSTSYIVFDAKQIKSADPVTRNIDDSSSIIPLKERFNQINPRYKFSKEKPANAGSFNGKKTASTRFDNEENINKYLTNKGRSKTKARTIKAYKNGENVVLRSDDEINNYIDKALNGEDVPSTVGYGIVPDKLSTELKAFDSDVNTSGYFLEFNTNDLRHAFNGHEKPKYDVDLPLSKKEMRNLPMWIDKYDHILEVSKRSDGVAVTLGKRINGYSVVVGLISDSRLSLRPKTVWKMKTKEYLEEYAEQIKKHTDLVARTSESEMKGQSLSTTNGNASIDNITNGSETVKGKASKEVAHRDELLSDAEESYGAKYTDDFNETGFIFPDGKLPKMGDYGQRAEDHNVVISLYDDIGYDTHQAPKSAAMGRFLDEGNIRIMPENGFIEMSAKVNPTPEQYSAIRRFLNEHDEAEIEFSGVDGRSVDSKSYSNGVNADQVINDIKRFYSEGKIGGSDLNNFRFSKEVNAKSIVGSTGKVTKEAADAYMAAAKAGDEETARKYVRALAEAKGGLPAYHGTNARFTVFDPAKLGSKNWNAPSAQMGFFAGKSRQTAEAYTGLDSATAAGRLSFSEEGKADAKAIREKHDADAVDDKFFKDREKFFDQYRKDNGWKEEVDDILDRLVLDETLTPELKERLNENLSRQLEYMWNEKHMNDMYAEFEKTDTAVKKREFDAKIYDEWEQKQIERLGYDPHVMELYAFMEKPFIHDFKGEGRDVESFAARMAKAKAQGYDGCMFLNVADGGELDDIYTVFSNKQFKSADAITRDDNNEIIPLSERFNFKNEDIRFSKEAKPEKPLTVKSVISDFTKDSRFAGDKKAFGDEVRELAELMRKDGLTTDVEENVDDIIAKHIKINEYEEWGEGIDPNVKSLIKSSAINISELGDGTIAHKLENIGLSKADVPSWVQLRSAKGGRSLDSVYHELSDERPDLFPPDASHEDKLLNIIEASKQEPEMARKPQEWIDGEKEDLKYDLITRVADADYAERKALEARQEVKETPKAERKKPAKPKEPEKTEVQKLHENDFASDEVKTALKDIEEAGVNVEKAEKIAKRFNDLDKKIGAKTKHIENAKKSEKYATEAERAERIAELEDDLASLKRRQEKAAGELENLGKMKAVDPNKTAEQQIKEMRGERKVNKELKDTENLTKTDNWIKDKWNSVRRLWEDSLIDVENTAKASEDKELRQQILTAANRVRNSMSVSNNWITNVRSKFDNTVGGKALDEIFNKELIDNEPKYADFQEYLIMKHVPARHAKGTDIYPEVSPALAEKRVKELEEKYGDEIKEWSQDVYDYINDLQQYRVDSGMISQKDADDWAKDYPFYVPTNRVNDSSGEIDFFTGGLSNGIRSAKGGDNDVLDMYSQLYTATNKTIHAAEENQMLNLYFKAKGVTEEQIKGATLDDLEHAVIEANVNKKTGKSTVSFFIDGKAVKLPCNHQLALGLRELDGLEFERLMKAAKVATLYGKPFKALITDWNLVFGVRNGARDLQQALVNSKDTRFFASSTGAAAHAIANADSPFRKLYSSMGGEQAQLVSYDAVAKQMGIEKQDRVDAIHEKMQDFVDFEIKGKNVNPIHYIEGINGAIEMMPRMCEFIGTLRKDADKILRSQGSSLKKLRKEIVDEVNALKNDGKIGATKVPAEVEDRLAKRIIDMVGKDSIDTAMRNANDITLNFGRNGVLGKALNMGFVPYLNPSIQGLSKLIRLFTEAGGEGGWKALASIGMKLGTFTIAPAVFNELALRDNEDYQNLNTRDKDNNFFIPLSRFGDEWDGKFFKFPKPRENAVLAEPIEYSLRYFLDDTEYAFFDGSKLSMEGVPLWEKIPLTDEGKQAFRTALDNIGVINPATSNMLSPLWQTFHNKTWYGGSIESAYETSINEETGKANVPVNKRYDTGTSGIAIQLGQTKVAKALNLSPKKIDNILDAYTGMIYDLGISQTTEEAKTRGNWFTRTMASQFVKDSVFSNKLSTNAWGKMDGMSKKEQDAYKSTYMYDTFKYDDAQDLITADKSMTAKEKMQAKRELQIAKNKLNREAIDGKQNTSNPLVDIAKHLGATKTLNHFLPDTGGENTDTWRDYFKNYNDAKGYSGLNKKQKEMQSQKFLDVYSLGVKGQLMQDPTKFHDSPSWGMTGVAAAELAKKGKLKGKDADLIMKSCGVYDSQTAVYHNYAKYGGNVKRYAITEKRVGKTLDKVADWGMDTKGGLWKGTFDKSMGAKGGTIAMSLATSKKVDFKDRAYYIANSSDPMMMDKMNAARGFSEKYGHKTKEISKLALQADAMGDSNTYLKNDEIINVCNQMKGNSEEKSMAYILLGGKPRKNPFGEIGNYSHDGDTGIKSLVEEKSGGGRRRGGRRGHRGGGGGGGGSQTTFKALVNTAGGGAKQKITKVKTKDPFSTTDTTKPSNLDEAYRRRAKKLREQMTRAAR